MEATDLYVTLAEMATTLRRPRRWIRAALRRDKVMVLRTGRGTHAGILVRRQVFDEWRLSLEMPADQESAQ